MPKRDVNQAAFLVVAIATGDQEKPDPHLGKNGHAVELGRLGGLKGGKARAEKLTSEQRKKIATKAAKKRWS